MKTPAQIVLEMTSPIPPIEGAERFFDRNQRLIDRAEKLIAEAMLEAFRQGADEAVNLINTYETIRHYQREIAGLKQTILIMAGKTRADRNGIYSP